jgi:23S rRNA G2069 N7-methylase RlmK/C1962 C5-methylase RlmI
LDALLSDKGAVESMREAIRGAMAASRSDFKGGGSGAAAAPAAGGPRRSGSRERRGGGGGEDEDGSGRRPSASSDRDRDRNGGGGYRDRGGGDRDRDRGRNGPPSSFARREAGGGGRGGVGGGDWRGGRGGRGGGRRGGGADESDPAAALRLASGFRLDLQSTALGRAAAARLADGGGGPAAAGVCVAVLHPTKTRLFDEQEAAAPSLVSTLASAAARDATAPAAAGASPMVFGGAVAFVARLGADGRCSADVAPGGASLPPARGGNGSRTAAGAARAEEAEDEEEEGAAAEDGDGGGGWPGPAAGDPVLVATPDGRCLAWGAYNGASMFRVRVLQTEAEALADEVGAGGVGGRRPEGGAPPPSSPPSSVALDVPRLLERRVREAADLRRALGLSVGPSGAVAAAPAKRRRRTTTTTTPTTAAEAAPAAAVAAPQTLEGPTDVFRLVNGEGDRLSGLVADQMGPHVVVVQSNAAWVERHRDEVERALRLALAPAAVAAAPAPAAAAASAEEAEGGPVRRRRRTTKAAAAAADDGEVRVIWRRAERMLREEGVPVAAAAASADEDDEEDDEEDAAEGEQPAAAAAAPVAPSTFALEAGLRFAVAPELGQKTGFYADQRENRAFVARLVAAGARGGGASASGGGGDSSNDVLDLCCYSGGFALAALRAGASRVDGVDSSRAALELARLNAQLNGIAVLPEPRNSDDGAPAATAAAAAASSTPPAPGPALALHRADASAFLSAANSRGQQWRVVVLDPPKLAPSRRDLERALRKYRHLNAAALRAVRPGGFLVTHSCSGAVARAPSLLQAVVCAAAASCGRQVTLVREAGAAADHPLHAAYPEGRYLTSLTFRVL